MWIKSNITFMWNNYFFKGYTLIINTNFIIQSLITNTTNTTQKKEKKKKVLRLNLRDKNKCINEFLISLNV